MKEVFSASFSSLRKDELRRQIFEAYQLNDLDKVYLLEFKWAHRYGLSTIPKNLQYQNSLEFEKTSSPQDFELEEEYQSLKLDSEENVARKECISSSLSFEPPPRTSLSYLRRWLPISDTEESTPKAS